MAAEERRVTENKDLVRRDSEEVWNKGNLNLVDEYVAEGFILHDPAIPDDLHGPEGYKQLVAMYRTAFPAAHIAIDELIAEDDTVLVRWTGRGTHQGEFVGVEPTDTEVKVPGTMVIHIEDGMVTGCWQNYDVLGMRSQLGADPSDVAQ